MAKQLSMLEQNLLAIANKLALAKKTITLETLHNKARKELGESSATISKVIYDLISKKYLVIGSKMTKTQVLLNEKRNKLHEYINKNPGCHLSELKRYMNIKGQLINWHLSILEKFDFIFSIRYLKYLTFFPKDFDRDYIIPYLSLKNENSYKIFSNLWEKPALNQSNLKSLVPMELPTIKYHINKLIESKVVLIQEIQDTPHYLINPEVLLPLQKFFNYKVEDLEDFIKFQNDTLQQKLEGIPAEAVEPTEPVELHPPAVESKVTVEAKETLAEKVRVLREYDYIGGGIRFKIAIQNISKTMLMDFNVTLVPTSQYEIDGRVKVINALKPGESRGVDFQLTPLTCGKSKVYGSVSYIDAFGEPNTTTVRPKEIWIKCPLVVPKQKSTSEIEDLKSRLSKGTTNLNFTDLQESDVFNLVRDQISALDLSEIVTDAQNMTTTYAGMAKVTGNDLIIEAYIAPQDKLIALEVWTNDMKQATGFLAYIKNMIVMAIKSAEKLKGKIDRISQKIVDASDIILKLNKLCLDCEQDWIVSDILLSLTESLNKIERSFPDIIVSEQIRNEIENIEGSFREGENIDTKTGINLEYHAINWIKSIHNIAENNLKIYEETFPEETGKVDQLSILIETVKEELEKLERSYALRILLYLMIIYKDSGITLFEHNFKGSVGDPDLLSGFLIAIQSFGTEISKEEVPMKKISYRNLEIEMTAGKKVICALLVNGEITERLSSLATKITKEFENKYAAELVDWTGDVTPFEDAKQLCEKIFR